MIVHLNCRGCIANASCDSCQLSGPLGGRTQCGAVAQSQNSTQNKRKTRETGSASVRRRREGKENAVNDTVRISLDPFGLYIKKGVKVTASIFDHCGKPIRAVPILCFLPIAWRYFSLEYQSEPISLRYRHGKDDTYSCDLEQQRTTVATVTSPPAVSYFLNQITNQICGFCLFCQLDLDLIEYY